MARKCWLSPIHHRWPPKARIIGGWKSGQNDHHLSRVVPLSADDRVQEIARMLSGDTITDTARAAAQDLLGLRTIG
jgi:DNA repair protein RecN (Recombination protein N)